MGKYYTLDRIKKIDAQFKILLGGRNIGKSYATKHDVVRDCFENNKEFVYLRRWDEDVKTKNVEPYFADLNGTEITNGKYSAVYIYQSKIYLCNMDDKMKPTDKFLIGYAHALNQSERYKSQIFPRVYYVIYEEFITDRLYLPNECDKLQNYASTIFRERVGVVYMVGNTISKLCPYFNEWKLDKVERMKVHEIALFENSTDVMTDDGLKTIEVRVAVEMCGAQSVLSKMAFGDSANMIVKNSWQSKSVARLSIEVYNQCDLLHTVFVRADNLTFRMELLNFNGLIFWYVSPMTRKIEHEEDTRIISESASMYPLHTNGFNPLTDTERTAFGLLKQNKIFYCSNSCGSDFEQVLKKYHVIGIMR